MLRAAAPAGRQQDRADRVRRAAALRREGMTVGAIAAVLTVGMGTVHRDLARWEQEHPDAPPFPHRRSPGRRRDKPPPRPRCGKPMRSYRTRTADLPSAWPWPVEDPVCGLPAGHPPHCLSEAAYEADLERRISPRRLQVKRERYAAARDFGLNRSEAIAYSSRTSLSHPAEFRRST